MISPAHGTTVLDGMATLVGVRPRVAGAQRSVPQVESVEPIRRNFDDRLDLSPEARALLRHGVPSSGTTVASGDVGRLIDVLA